MAKYEWSEIFTSIEGEGPHTGVPTAYIRFTKCNFKCKGFNNPNNVDTETDEGLGFNPTMYKTLQDLPPITVGCDSIYAWDNRFKHMWHSGDTDQLVDQLIDTLPHKSFKNPKNGFPIILSLTGGEPTLRQKQIPELLNHPKMVDCEHILIETNCSVPIRDDFILALDQWKNPKRKITFSNSPKMAASGEKWEDAIKPQVALRQEMIDGAEIYFKFVCSDSERDFEEVERAMQTYWDAGVSKRHNVYIMPMGCISEQQDSIAANVAQMCMDRGYIYCHRVHLDVFNNAIGT
jgi:organic radical activating enzyme